MRAELASGLLYAHSRDNSNKAKLLGVSSLAYAAIELLAERVLINIEDLDRKKEEIADPPSAGGRVTVEGRGERSVQSAAAVLDNQPVTSLSLRRDSVSP